MPNLPVEERWQWLQGKNQYRDLNTGRFASWQSVRNSVDDYIGKSAQRIDGLSTQLRNGEINVAEWQQGMRNEIKIGNRSSGMIGKGGRANMTQSDWGRIGQRIRSQYEYLDNFANDIATGRIPLDGRINARAKLYAEADRGTFEQVRRADERASGRTEEMRVLHAAEHCDDCIEAAGHWAAIGTLPAIGDSACRSNCRCTFQYR